MSEKMRIIQQSFFSEDFHGLMRELLGKIPDRTDNVDVEALMREIGHTLHGKSGPVVVIALTNCLLGALDQLIVHAEPMPAGETEQFIDVSDTALPPVPGVDYPGETIN